MDNKVISDLKINQLTSIPFVCLFCKKKLYFFLGFIEQLFDKINVNEKYHRINIF